MIEGSTSGRTTTGARATADVPPRTDAQRQLMCAETNGDRRRATRTALALRAIVREPRQGRYAVTIVDMSTHGCRVELTCASMSEQWIWLSVTGLETQYCRVVWHDGGFVGLEFAAPLSDAVFERLLADQQQVSERLVLQLREIARRASAAFARSDDPDRAEPLLEFSRECAERAAVHGLELGCKHTGREVPAGLTGSLIRRTVEGSSILL